jgi:hypothetical protein
MANLLTAAQIIELYGFSPQSFGADAGGNPFDATDLTTYIADASAVAERDVRRVIGTDAYTDATAASPTDQDRSDAVVLAHHKYTAAYAYDRIAVQQYAYDSAETPSELVDAPALGTETAQRLRDEAYRILSPYAPASGTGFAPTVGVAAINTDKDIPVRWRPYEMGVGG